MEGKIRGVIFLLLFTIYAFSNADSITSKLYRLVYVSATNLSLASTEEHISRSSAIICAMEATRRPWCHLMCYQNKQCSLYDLSFQDHGNDATGDGDSRCWTDGEAGPTGLTSLTTPPGFDAASCTGDFTTVPGVGDLYISTVQNEFTEATVCCSTLGGQLVVPLSFEAFRDYLLSLNPPGDKYWVGAKDGSWLNGVTISQEEYSPNEPDNYFDCAYVEKAHDFKVVDYFCSEDHYFICQI